MYVLYIYTYFDYIEATDRFMCACMYVFVCIHRVVDVRHTYITHLFIGFISRTNNIHSP